MKFTTEVELTASRQPISHSSRITMLGSCFTDNIGVLLSSDGFDVSINAMGILFNPASIAKVINRAVTQKEYTQDDLFRHEGIWHCLDFASQRQDTDDHKLLKQLNEDFTRFVKRLSDTDTLIITFGTAWVFDHIPSHSLVGNCHKLPASQFIRRRLSIDEIVNIWKPICQNRHIIFTVSPVRHLADGLHGNALSKSILLLATERLCQESNCEYFPSYEILNDELRDYRFYAADMKHPSEVAIEYIYDRFQSVYFTPQTRLQALEHRRLTLRQNHRPIL